MCHHNFSQVIVSQEIIHLTIHMFPILEFFKSRFKESFTKPWYNIAYSSKEFLKFTVFETPFQKPGLALFNPTYASFSFSTKFYET